MAFTAKQFGFLLKQKVIKRNTLITVKLQKKVDISNNYERNFNFQDNGLITKVFIDPKTKTLKIEYLKQNTYDKKFVCNLSDIATIEGQTPERYYQAYLDILANANPFVIDDLTNVEKDVIGKSEAEIANHTLFEGMKLILKNDVNPNYNNKILNVRNVGKKIKLTGNAGRPKKERLQMIEG